MKKLILLITITVFLVPVFCETAEATLNMLAYKDVYVPTIENTTITVKYNNASINPGQEFTITESLTTSGTNYKLTNAFVVSVVTNRKNPVSISFDFSPLVNRQNQQTKVPISYSITSTSDTSDSSPIEAEYTDIDTEELWIVITTLTQQTETQYGYVATLALTDSATSVSVSAANEWTQAVLSYRVNNTKTRTRTKSYWSRNFGSWGNWADATMPEEEGDALPHLGQDQRITTTASFDLLIEQTDFENLIANQDYAATVRMTVVIE